MKEDVVYKIRNKEGLYSTGGQNPRFVKGGKVWNTLGHIKQHLREFYPRPKKLKFNNDEYNEVYEKHEATKNKIPGDWEIVSFVPNNQTIIAKNILT